MGVPEAVPLLGDLVEAFGEFLDDGLLVVHNFDDGRDILLFALPGILGRLSVAFELFVLGEFAVALELPIGRILILWFVVLPVLHQFGHLIPVEHLLLLLRVVLQPPLVLLVLSQVLLLFRLH